jgi:hypothetical protein
MVTEYRVVFTEDPLAYNSDQRRRHRRVGASARAGSDAGTLGARVANSMRALQSALILVNAGGVYRVLT